MKLLLLLFVLLGQSCSDSPVTGGAHVPNFVKGLVTDVDGNPIAGSTVYLRKTTLTNRGEEVVLQYDTVSAIDGTYSFEDVASGESYIVSENDSLVSVKRVDVPNEGELSVGATLSSKKTTLVGRVFGDKQINAFMPGLLINAKVDSENVYELHNVPTLSKSVIFLSGDVCNSLNFTIHKDRDTVFIKDVDFVYENGEEVNDDLYELSHFVMTPTFYALGDRPLWYVGKDFDVVDYDNETEIPFEFTGKYDSLWTNPLNWVYGIVPSEDDSVTILSGKCVAIKITNSNVVTIGKKAILKPYNSNFTKLRSDGGVYYPKDGSISREIVIFDTLNYFVEKDSIVRNYGKFIGDGVLIKYGGGYLDLYSSSTEFSGFCDLQQGRFRGRSLNCLGKSELIIRVGSIFDIEKENALSDFTKIVVESNSKGNGKLEINETSTAKNVYFGADKLTPGDYTLFDFPDFITDSNHVLTVVE